MGTYEKVLVRCLLVLLGHGGWWASGEAADTGEETEGDDNTGECVSEDLPSLSWGRDGTGTVGTEGNPVSYSTHNTSATYSYIYPHTLTRPHLSSQTQWPSNIITSARSTGERETYRPSSPAGSAQPNWSSCDRAGPSRHRPAPAAASAPSDARCWRGLGWRWRGRRGTGRDGR